jgi:hypothetical protein
MKSADWVIFAGLFQLLRETSLTPWIAVLIATSQAGHEVILLCEKDPGAIQVGARLQLVIL